MRTDFVARPPGLPVDALSFYAPWYDCATLAGRCVHMSQRGRQIEVKNVWKVFGDNPEAALQPENASKSRDEMRAELGVVVALRDVSFAVDAGEVFVVMGLSGSGKSTLVRCLIRLAEATSGQIYFDGEEIHAYSTKQMEEFRRSKVAMVFQHYALLPHRNVMD